MTAAGWSPTTVKRSTGDRALLTDLVRRTLGLLQIDCSECDGSGEIYFETGDDDGYWDPCDTCYGTGHRLLGETRNR